MKNNQRTTRIAYIALLSAIGIICSYVEVLIPFNFGIPGIKLGLANISAIIALYLFSFPAALLVQIVRISIVGILFGNIYSIIYSLAGGIISIVIMNLLRKINKFSVIGVSISGAITHNMAQLIIAIFIVNQLKLSMYGPILIVSGVFMGLFIGVISVPVLKVLKHMFEYGNIKI